MKYVGKIIIGLLILLISYFGYNLSQLRKELFNVYDVSDKYAYTPEEYDLVIVDFNKYGCSSCRLLHPILMEAIKRDGKVRYVPRNVTHGFIWNETLSSAVYAAAEQGKFIELHNLIYKNWPIETHDLLFRYAKAIGLDTKKLSRDMSDPKIRELVSESQMYFDAWQLEQTPALLMGNKAIYRPGKNIPTVEEMMEKLSKARSE